MVLIQLKMYETMQKTLISVPCEGEKNNVDMFTCSINIALLESSLLVTPFSALLKLRCFSYQPDWGLGVTSLNRPPTGGEVTALVGSDSWSPLLTHQGFQLLL